MKRIEMENYIEDVILNYKREVKHLITYEHADKEEYVDSIVRSSIYVIIQYAVNDFMEGIYKEIKPDEPSETFKRVIEELDISLKHLREEDIYCDDQCSPPSSDSEYYSSDECACFSLCTCGLFDSSDSSDSDY